MTGFRTLARSTTLALVAVCAVAGTRAAAPQADQPELDDVLGKLRRTCSDSSPVSRTSSPRNATPRNGSFPDERRGRSSPIIS